MIRIFTTLFIFGFLLSSNATVFQSTVSSGDWNSGATWDQSGAVPTANDTVSIQPGHHITVTENDSCKRLTIHDEFTSRARLTINASDTLWVLDSVEISDSEEQAEIFVNISGHLHIGGNLVIRFTSDACDMNFNILSGGSVFIESSSNRNELRAGGASASISNFDFVVNSGGSFISNSEVRIYCEGTDATPINFQVDDNVIINNVLALRSEFDANASINVDVNDTLDIEELDVLVQAPALNSASIINLGTAGGTIMVSGPVATEGTIFSDGNNSSFVYDGSSTQTIRVDANTTYHNLVLNNAAGTNLGGELTKK